MDLQTIEEEIRDNDFMYQNAPVKIIANRNSPEIKLVGFTVGPFEEGVYYEERFWVAEELVRSGIARFHEGELLDLKTLSMYHARMKVSPYPNFQELPQFFYPKARRFLSQLKEKAMKDPDSLMQYKNALNMFKDIYRARKSKINSAAKNDAMTEQYLENLTPEEKALYQTIKDANDRFEKMEEETREHQIPHEYLLMPNVNSSF